MYIKEDILRGQMYFAALDPVIGSEQGGTRPVLIVQNDVGNRYSDTVVAAPITTARESKHNVPTHVFVRAANGLTSRSIVLLEQLRTLDKRRLLGYIGSLDNDDMDRIDRALGISVGLDELPDERLYERPDEMILCLCPECLNQFINSPEHVVLRLNPFQREKDDCTYCGMRKGYDYRVISKRTM